MRQIVFDPIFGSYTLVLLCAGGLCLLTWISRPTSDQLPRYGQRILLTLRLLALLCLLFGMLRPVLVHTVSQRLSAVVNILLDQTQSMTRNDEIGGKSRFAAAKEALQQASPQLRRMQRQADVKAFTFESTLTPLELQEGQFIDLPDAPKGTETALGFILDGIRERSAGKRVLATIMLTDGAQRTRPSRDILPQDAATRLRDTGIPLYTVPLGQAGLDSNIRDVAVESVHANDRVFVKNKLLVTGTMRISGYADQNIPVQLLFETEGGKQEIVANSTVQAKEDGQEVRFSLSYAPQTVGLFKYTVRVPPQEREVTDRNNEQSSFVQVLEGGLRVLYIQGPHNFEQRPLRESLHASPDIQVQYIRVKKPGDLMSALKESPTPFNVFILDDIDSTMFTTVELQTLVEYVYNDAGLMMLGGLNAFSAGGYAGTPLAHVSPIELRQADRQPLNTPPRDDIHWSAMHPIPMLLTEQGARHYVMQFDAEPAVNARRWAALPPLLGANHFDRVKPGAVVLAVGPNRQILLVSQLAGLGRVLAFAGDSTWRWRLAGFEEEHKTFWRQVVLWLAKMEGGGDGTCWMTVENNRLMPGDAAKFQIFLRSETGEEIRDFQAKATVLKSDNTTESVPLVAENGIPTGSFRSTEFSGDYRIQAEVTYNGDVKHATGRFLVQDRNLELDNPVAYPKLLADIATLTGGKTVPPEQLGALMEDLIKQSNELVEKRETKRTLFDTWTLLLIFIGILSAEWFLRKYWGLA
ncbi:MAG: hypothetical protein LBI05_08000 [Planctomycetaceae bacterium]|nr:hypothetical protein [Planctomycetaceae bacterium]